MLPKTASASSTTNLDGWPASCPVEASPVTEIMVVSVYEKVRYGIARYPLEEVKYFKDRGFKVTTVGLTKQSEADLTFDLTTLGGLKQWLGFCLKAKAAAVSFHYYDGLAFPSISPLTPLRWLGRLVQAAALAALGKKARCSRAMIHEIPFSEGIGSMRRWTSGYCLSRFHLVEFFTEVVREKCLAHYPQIRKERTAVVEHDRYMESQGMLSREEARGKLGLPADKVIFLCIGWWAPQKGFPMAMESFAAAAPPEAELWIVGDIPAKDEPSLAFKKHIEDLARSAKNIHTKNDYVSDEAFDLWLRAANHVVLPYSSSTNSGVGARAKVAGCGLVVKGLETLREQFPEALIFETPEELTRVFREHGTRAR